MRHYDPNIHHRRSIRLKDYDYARAGAYFVTICAYSKRCLFGVVEQESIRLNDFGEIVLRSWNDLPNHYATVELDAFVVMPNHVHGIVVITEGVGAGFPRPRLCSGSELESIQKGAETAPLREPTLGRIIAYFKYQSTKKINALRRTPGKRLWQRNYYEHVIRNPGELNRAREYIINNPLRWTHDRENADCVVSHA